MTRPSQPRLDHLLFLVASLGLGGGILAFMAVQMSGPTPDPWLGMDYGTFRAGADALTQGRNPWVGADLDILAAASLPRNPGDVPGCMPGWLVLHAALLPLSPTRAALVWAAASWAAQVVGVAVLLRAFAGSASRGRVAAIAAFGLLFPPALGTVFMGQGSGFVGLALALLFAARRPLSEAGALVLGALVKVFPGGLLVWAASTRRWRTCALALVLLVAAQLPAVALRPGVVADFVRGAWEVSSDQAPANAAILANQSLRGALLRLHEAGGPDLAAAWPVLAVGLLAALGVATARGQARGLDDRALLAGVACGVSALAPYLWHHSFSALTPVFMLAMLWRPSFGIAGALLSCVPFVFDHVALPQGAPRVAFGSFGLVALLGMSVAWLSGAIRPPGSGRADPR